jgi:hypothetical protein
MTRIRALSLATLLIASSSAGALPAQVSVAPTILFTSEREPFATFAVNNGSTTPQEVEIEFRFGYPRSDGGGALVMEYEDSAAAARYSVDSWVQAFPRRFVLGPGAQQVVRMAVRPPVGLEPGAYWTRVVTTSTPREAAVDTASGGVATRIVMRLQHVTTLIHRSGASASGVELGAVTVARSELGRPRVTVPLRRTGNNPFLGMATVEVRDAAGAVVARTERAVSVYFDVQEQLTVEDAVLAPGRYRVIVTVRPGRPDVPPEYVVPADPVARQVDLDW